MLKITEPQKLNGQIQIDDIVYNLDWKVENEKYYLFTIEDEVLIKIAPIITKDQRTYGLSINREYVTINDMGEDIYNNIGIKKIIKVELTSGLQKVIHMISLTDLKDIQKFKRVVEGMIIGLNEKIENQTIFPPLQQWTGSSHITHSTMHGIW